MRITFNWEFKRQSIQVTCLELIQSLLICSETLQDTRVPLEGNPGFLNGFLQ